MTYERSFSCEFLVRVSWTENLGRLSWALVQQQVARQLCFNGQKHTQKSQLSQELRSMKGMNTTPKSKPYGWISLLLLLYLVLKVKYTRETTEY